MSALSAAKNIKCIAGFTESEILSGISQMKDEEQTTISKVTQQLIQRMKKIDTTKVSAKKKRKLDATPEEMLFEVLIKMNKALDEYDRSDKIDRIAIDFKVGVSYDGKSLKEICLVHQNLMSNTFKVDHIRLLIFR
jgi:flagellar hook-basal body complex protein FliE